MYLYNFTRTQWNGLPDKGPAALRKRIWKGISVRLHSVRRYVAGRSTGQRRTRLFLTL